ncbi:MAG TPA: TauD/TfdA family dioxygenase [Gemmataceae bacterium]|nr:TauD/TfdA family dioxygenase [Gemmataceae bacterium]
MLTYTITDPRAWRSNTIDDRQLWYYPLSPRCLAALDETICRLRDQPRPTLELCAAELPLADCAGDFQLVRSALEDGRGFAILQGPTPQRYTPQEMQVCYWLIGQMLGRPVEQNVQGTLLYDVRDTGQDVRYGARFSVTNAESSFHTDNSFGAGVADYVGLLCIQTAKSGGLSQVVSGYSVHNELLARHRELLEILYQPLHIDRRGGRRPGEPPTVLYPVLSWDGRGLTYRYLRYWIESGHEKIGQPLRDAQRRALDALDEVAHDAALRVEFELEPGDLFFINNRWILHNRTAFEDHAEPEQRRHLVRLWLRAE